MAALNYKCFTPYTKANNDFVGFGAELSHHDYIHLPASETANYVSSLDPSYNTYFPVIGDTVEGQPIPDLTQDY